MTLSSLIIRPLDPDGIRLVSINWIGSFLILGVNEEALLTHLHGQGVRKHLGVPFALCFRFCDLRTKALLAASAAFITLSLLFILDIV